jgi:hypothetical protein
LDYERELTSAYKQPLGAYPCIAAAERPASNIDGRPGIRSGLLACGYDEDEIDEYLDNLTDEEAEKDLSDHLLAFEKARRGNESDLERAQSDSNSHQQRMSKIYANYDRSLRDAWRRRRTPS